MNDNDQKLTEFILEPLKILIASHGAHAPLYQMKQAHLLAEKVVDLFQNEKVSLGVGIMTAALVLERSVHIAELSSVAKFKQPAK